MLTYYSKGQKAEFVMTEQSAVRVESSGVSGNIFIKPLIGKERIISLNFAPFYTQLDDFDAGTIVFLSVDSGFGRVGIEVSGNNTVQIVNNQSLLSFKFGNRLNPPIVPVGEDGVLFVDQNGILCTVDKLGNVFEIGASRLAPSALAALSNVVIFEKSYEMMTADERTASAEGGGYAAFAVSRNAGVSFTESPSYQIHSSATRSGTYTLDADNVLYAPSALLEGQIGYDHRSLSFTDEINFPVTISPNTLAIICDTSEQKELCLLNGIILVAIGNELAKTLPSVGVATHYSVPVRVALDDTARVYVLTTYGQDQTLRPIGERFYKITPKDSLGNIKPLADISPISFKTIGVRNMPNPPRMMRAGFNGLTLEALSEFPDKLDGSRPTFGFKPSSKELDVTPSSQFNASGTLEAGVVYKVDVESLNGSITPVRTLILDNTTGLILYTQLNKRSDGERVSTKYTFYADKSGIKSLPFPMIIEQGAQEPNMPETVVLSQVSNTVKSLITTTRGTFGVGTGEGVEHTIHLIQLSGTLLPNINLAGITLIGSGAELVGLSTGDGSNFYVQLNRDVTTYELTLPYTSGLGLNLIVKSGSRNDNRTSNTLTIA